LRHIGNQLTGSKALALWLDAAMLQPRQLKQLLRKMADFLPLSQGNGQIMLRLFRRQGIGFQ
jgi:hypothetical protein